MKRLELHISYRCLNDCLFCSEQDALSMLKGKIMPTGIILRKIRQFYLKGYRHVTFTGGEPSLHSNFINIVQFAKLLGYTTYVTTNGGEFSKKRFSEVALEHLDEICFSVHGSNYKVHDFLTRKRGSFNNLKKALDRFETHRTPTFGLANIVITRYNIKILKSIINMLAEYKKIKQLIFSNFSPEGGGLKNFNDLMVPLKQIQEKIPELVDCCRHFSFKPVFFGLPLCTLFGHEELSNDYWWSPRTTIELLKQPKKTLLKTTYSFKPNRERVQTKKCESCLKKNVCGGMFEKYIHALDDFELSPFRS
ncbi:MAG: radical SAM protein [Candidatus Omnitrophota bacterium]